MEQDAIVVAYIAAILENKVCLILSSKTMRKLEHWSSNSNGQQELAK